jgi:hypothetical protein
MFKVEDGPIGAQLIETAFIFVSAWDIPVKKKNIEYFRKMFGQFNFFPTIRADATGYFAIFDDIDGIGKAEACFDRFKSWKFRKAKMNMKVNDFFHLRISNNAPSSHSPHSLYAHTSRNGCLLTVMFP